MVSSVLSLVYFLGSQFFGSHPYRTPPVLGIGITHSTPSDDPANTLHLESRSEAVVIIRSYTNADPLCYLKDALSDTGAGFCRTLTRALTPRNPRERSFLRSLLAQVFEYVGDEYPGGTFVVESVRRIGRWLDWGLADGLGDHHPSRGRVRRPVDPTTDDGRVGHSRRWPDTLLLYSRGELSLPFRVERSFQMGILTCAVVQWAIQEVFIYLFNSRLHDCTTWGALGSWGGRSGRWIAKVIEMVEFTPPVATRDLQISIYGGRPAPRAHISLQAEGTHVLG